MPAGLNVEFLCNVCARTEYISDLNPDSVYTTSNSKPPTGETKPPTDEFKAPACEATPDDSKRTTVRQRPRASTDKFPITASLAIGMEFFIKRIPLLSPKIYRLGEIRSQPLMFYSDAEWKKPST